MPGRIPTPPNHSLFSLERRHVSSRVPVYQDMPSSRLVTHDGVLCTFSNRSAPDRGKWCGDVVRQGRRQGLSTVHRPAGTLFSSQPGGPPCWATPLAFGLIAPPSTTVNWLLAARGGRKVRLIDIPIPIRSSDCIGRYNRLMSSSDFWIGRLCRFVLSSDSLIVRSCFLVLIPIFVSADCVGSFWVPIL